MSHLSTIAGLALVTALSAGASASIIVFEDNFNAERNGVGLLNYTGFSNWSVSNGTVDLIGNGYFDFLPGNGLYLDLDGSTNNAGMITSDTISLPKGLYELSFDLAGNRRNGASESVNVSFGDFYSAALSRTQSQGFITETYSFKVRDDASASFVFDHSGGDNIGLLLDNVRVTSVPGPGSAGLAAIAGVLILRRRRVKKA